MAARSKTEQEGEGAFAYLPPATMCAIMQANGWRDPRTVPRYGAKLTAGSGTSARTADDQAAAAYPIQMLSS